MGAISQNESPEAKTWELSVKMTVSREPSIKAAKTMGALKGGGQLQVHWSFYLRGRYGHR